MINFGLVISSLA